MEKRPVVDACEIIKVRKERNRCEKKKALFQAEQEKDGGREQEMEDRVHEDGIGLTV